jgi:hypothetical protein
LFHRKDFAKPESGFREIAAQFKKVAETTLGAMNAVGSIGGSDGFVGVTNTVGWGEAAVTVAAGGGLTSVVLGPLGVAGLVGWGTGVVVVDGTIAVGFTESESPATWLDSQGARVASTAMTTADWDGLGAAEWPHPVKEIRHPKAAVTCHRRSHSATVGISVRGGEKIHGETRAGLVDSFCVRPVQGLHADWVGTARQQFSAAVKVEDIARCRVELAGFLTA